MSPLTFLAVPRFVAAVVFLVVDDAALGLPARAFLGAAVGFLVVAAAFAFAGAAFAAGFLVVAAGLVADFEGGLEF